VTDSPATLDWETPHNGLERGLWNSGCSRFGLFLALRSSSRIC
jgi:hypothetical protein